MGGLRDAGVKTKTSVAGAETTVSRPLQQERSNGLWCPSKSVFKSKTFVLMSLKARPTEERLRKQQCAFRMRHAASQLEAQLPGSRIQAEAPLTWSTSKHLHTSLFFSPINGKHWPGLRLSSRSRLLSSPLSLDLSHLHAYTDSLHAHIQSNVQINPLCRLLTIAKGYGYVVTMVTQIAMLSCKQWKQVSWIKCHVCLSACTFINSLAVLVDTGERGWLYP